MTETTYIYIKVELHCINSRLLNSKMGIYASISSCASKILVFPVWYMLFCSTVTEFLCQTKVNNVELPDNRKITIRPCKSWRRDIECIIQLKGYTSTEMECLTWDRRNWRSLVSGPCSKMEWISFTSGQILKAFGK